MRYTSTRFEDVGDVHRKQHGNTGNIQKDIRTIQRHVQTKGRIFLKIININSIVVHY